MIDITAEQLTRESTHFRFHFPATSYAAQNIGTVLTQAERTYRALTDALKLTAGSSSAATVGGEKIDVVLVEWLDDERDPERKLPSGARVIDGAIWLVYNPTSPGDGLDRALLRLLAARGLGANAEAAGFFIDGLALYLSAGSGRAAQRAVEASDERLRALMATGGTTISIFPLLDQGGAEAPNYETIAHAFVGFLIGRANLETFKQFLARYDPAQRDAASQAVYYRSLGQLEEEWRATLRKTKSSGISLRQFFGQVLFYIRPFLRYEIEIFFLMLIGLGFSLVMPYANAYLIDNIINAPGDLAQKTRDLIGFLLLLFVLFAINGVAGFRRAYLSGFVNESIVRRLRLQIFSRLQALSASFYNQNKTGDIMARMTNDLGMVQSLLSNTLLNGIYQALQLVFASIIVLSTNWLLGLIVILAMPALTISYNVLRDRAVAASRERQQRVSDVVSAIEENLGAQSVVKAFRLENHMINSFTARLDALFKASLRLTVISAMFGTSINLIVVLINIIVLGVGGYLVISGQLQLGQLIAFLGYMTLALSPVTTLSTMSQEIQQASGAMERVMELVEEEPRIKDKPGAVDIPPVSHDIRFENVTFSYTGEQPTLSDLTLTIPAATSVAFVGPSGAGKSSTIQLLLRFYDPDSGRILYDGVDLRDATLKSIRDQTAIVFQDTFVFNTSMRENIAFGREGATDAEVIEAAKAAKLHDFIMALPRGYDTVVGERGARMSGGQRQRLAIARAILKNPAILILDEATSALDPQTEAEINETLLDLSRGRTTITITHRLSSVVTCDQIFVLERGRLVEQGTHGELVRAGGLYQRLFEEQTGYITGSSSVRVGVEVNRVRAVPLFANLPQNELEAIAANLTIERKAAGETIFHQGDAAEALYIIHRGEVEVLVKDAAGEERRVNKLHNGDYFGEIALLHDVTRTATVRTTEPTLLYGLSKADFTALLQRLPTLREQIELSSTLRMQDTAAKLAQKR